MTSFLGHLSGGASTSRLYVKQRSCSDICEFSFLNNHTLPPIYISLHAIFLSPWLLKSLAPPAQSCSQAPLGLDFLTISFLCLIPILKFLKSSTYKLYPWSARVSDCKLLLDSVFHLVQTFQDSTKTKEYYEERSPGYPPCSKTQRIYVLELIALYH